MPTELTTTPYTGRYTRAFLDKVFGSGTYHVVTFSLTDLGDQDVRDEAAATLDDPTLSLAYMSDTKLTCLFLHDHPGWLNFCEPMGIEITPSPKIAKRLTVVTRTTYLHHLCGLDDLDIRIVSCDSYSDYKGMVDEDYAERFLDGASVIARELIEEMMTTASDVIDAQFMEHGQGNPWLRGTYNTEIDRAGSGSLRVTGPFGEIKGDVIFSTRERMGGADILTVRPNVKHEFATHDFVFVLVEPHPSWKRHHASGDEVGPPPVWTDDQTMSWLGDWLFPVPQLEESLSDFADATYDALEAHTYPPFFTDFSCTEDPYTTIGTFQSQALEFERRGPARESSTSSLSQSIFLQERVAQGAINMLGRKRRWPVPAAAYLHVATDSWLHMAGFADENGHDWPFNEPQTPRGVVWVHEPTGRLIYNDLDFADLYDRHGGWDLDDSVKAHFRTYQGRHVVVTVRSPNSYGEYDIKNHAPGTWHAPWIHADGTVTAFPALGEVEPPAYIEDIDVTYDHVALDPETLDEESHPLTGDHYTPERVRDAMDLAIEFRGVLGSRINADMVYYHTTGSYRTHQVASIESMVDAATQEQSSTARELIEQDTQDTVEAVVATGKVVDRLLWDERLKILDPRVDYQHLDWSGRVMLHAGLCTMQQSRLMVLAQRAADLVDDQIIALGERCAVQGHKLVEWYYRLMRYLPAQEGETQRERCARINDEMITTIMRQPTARQYDLVFGIARHCYTVRRGSVFKDTVLFQSGITSHAPSVFNLYLDAIGYYDIGQEDYVATHTCTCGVTTVVTDRLERQVLHYGGCVHAEAS